MTPPCSQFTDFSRTREAQVLSFKASGKIGQKWALTKDALYRAMKLWLLGFLVTVPYVVH